MSQNLTIYRASAGTGKTYTLACEYIAKLLSLGEANAHRHILAVTFTNKATGEMKTRILDFLYQLANGQGADIEKKVRELSNVLSNVSSAELRGRAQRALDELLHDYNHFDVQTLDSFFQRLLTNLSHELGLPSRFNLDLDSGEAIDEAVDATMAQGGENDRKLRQYIVDFCEKRMREEEGWKLDNTFKQFCKKQVLLPRFQQEKEALSNFFKNEQAVRDFEKRMCDERDDCCEGGDKYKEIIEEQQSILALCDQNSVLNKNGLPKLVKSLKSRLDYALKNNLKKLYGPTLLNYMTTGAVDDFLVKRSQGDKAAELFAQEVAERAKTWIEQLLELAKQKNTAEMYLANLHELRLLNYVSEELDKQNGEQDRFLLAQTPLLFNKIVGDSDAPFIFERVGSIYNHVMIDEFQDTARIQWNNIEHLIAEKQAAGESCLVVGDVKQSIYRWNGGDAKILQGLEGTVVSLDVNYRSEKRIVDFNREFFKIAAKFADGKLRDSGTIDTNESPIEELYAGIENSTANKKDNAGWVWVALASSPTKSNEFAYRGTKADGFDYESETCLLRQVLRLHEEGVAWNDMAILGRKAAHLALALQYFGQYNADKSEAEKIPVVSDEAYLLSASPAVNIIVNAMRHLQDMKRRQSQAAQNETQKYKSISTYSVFLAKLYQEMRDTGFTLAQLEEHDVNEFLPTEFVERAGELINLPLFELAEELIRIFDLSKMDADERLRGHGDFVLSFLDHILDFLQGHPSDLNLFLRFWDEKMRKQSIPTSDPQGIRLLTIHKSKGLEAHTVLIPIANWESTRGNSGKEYIWADTGGNAPLASLPIAKSSKMLQSDFSEAFKQEHIQEVADEVNLAYVAFTRAAKNLLIWSTPHSDSKDDFTLGEMIAQAMMSMSDMKHQASEIDGRAVEIFESGSPTLGTKKASRQTSPFEVHPQSETAQFFAGKAAATFRMSGDAIRFVSDEDTIDEEQQSYIDRGKLLHYTLSLMKTADDLDNALRQVEAEGLLDKSAKDAARKLLAKRLADGQPHEWFDGSWTLHNECTILSTGPDGKTLARRPDRVMTRNGETIVVDFKFGKQRTEHKEQVSDYVSLLRKMGQTNVSGYLWYVYTNTIIQIN